MKGLEFQCVLLAGVQAGTMPLMIGTADDASEEDRELQERCLLYVAATRARDELVITGFGEQCPLIAQIQRMQLCSESIGVRRLTHSP